MYAAVFPLVRTRAFTEPFDYLVPPGLPDVRIGSLVAAPLGGQVVLGVVVGMAATSAHAAKALPLNDVVDLPPLPAELVTLAGKVRDDRSVDGIEVPYNGAKQVTVLPRYPGSSPVFFVRCQLFDRNGKLVVDNVYWQSQKDDDLGARRNDSAMDLRQDSWADMTALNTMPAAAVEVSARLTQAGGTSRVTVRVRNPSERIAFFERATVSTAREGNEILPIEYDDNYITVFPGEAAEIHAVILKGTKPGWVKLEGYNTPATSVPLL